MNVEFSTNVNWTWSTLWEISKRMIQSFALLPLIYIYVNTHIYIHKLFTLQTPEIQKVNKFVSVPILVYILSFRAHKTFIEKRIQAYTYIYNAAHRLHWP